TTTASATTARTRGPFRRRRHRRRRPRRRRSRTSTSARSVRPTTPSPRSPARARSSTCAWARRSMASSSSAASASSRWRSATSVSPPTPRRACRSESSDNSFREASEDSGQPMKKRLITFLAITALSAACASYNAFERGRTAEKGKNWDEAVLEYEKALDVDPDNMRYRVFLQRAKLEASRVHFEKGKSLRMAATTAKGTGDELRLAQMAAGELEIVIRLDPTNQFAMDELTKALATINEAQQVASGKSIDEIKKEAKKNITKVQPPQLNPASDQPISLSFPHETPVKE